MKRKPKYQPCQTCFWVVWKSPAYLGEGEVGCYRCLYIQNLGKVPEGCEFHTPRIDHVFPAIVVRGER